mgnify:CR=1 FL=1
MKQSAKRLSSMVMVLILVIVAFVIFFNFTQPAYKDVQIMRGEKIGRQAFVDSKQAVIKQVQNLIKSFKDDAELKSTQAAVNLSFPIDQNVEYALTQISGLLNLNDLTIESIGIAEVVASKSQRTAASSAATSKNFVKPVNKVSFTLSLMGSYSNFKSFLENLETNIRIFDIEQISLSPFSQKNPNLYNFSLKITAYYQGRE